MRGIRILHIIIISAIGMFLLFPVYWMFNTSFQSRQELFRNPPVMFPNRFDFKHYTSIFTDYMPHVASSILIAVLSIGITLAIGIPAAYALAKFKIKGASLFMLILLITQMFPLVMLITPLYLNFSHLGLMNNYLAVSLAVATNSVPFSVLVLRSFMVSISKELREAALVDGNTEWGVFIRIMIPVSLTGIATITVFTFLFSWGDFIFGMSLLSDNQMQPLTTRLYFSIGQYETDWSKLMSVASFLTVPAILFVIFSQRAIMNGIGNVSVNK